MVRFDPEICTHFQLKYSWHNIFATSPHCSSIIFKTSFVRTFTPYRYRTLGASSIILTAVPRRRTALVMLLQRDAHFGWDATEAWGAYSLQLTCTAS